MQAWMTFDEIRSYNSVTSVSLQLPRVEMVVLSVPLQALQPLPIMVGMWWAMTMSCQSWYFGYSASWYFGTSRIKGGNGSPKLQNKRREWVPQAGTSVRSAAE